MCFWIKQNGGWQAKDGGGRVILVNSWHGSGLLIIDY